MRKLSVPCLSVKRVHCDKTEERSVQFFKYHTRDHLAYFTEKKNDWWGRPLHLKFRVNWPRVGAKSQIWNRYSLVAPQP